MTREYTIEISSNDPEQLGNAVEAIELALKKIIEDSGIKASVELSKHTNHEQ